MLYSYVQSVIQIAAAIKVTFFYMLFSLIPLISSDRIYLKCRKLYLRKTKIYKIVFYVKVFT